MRITAVTGHILSSPFTYGGPAGPGGNLHLRDIDTLLVRVETDAGITGWGEAFGFNLVRTTRQALTELIAPVCQGEAAGDIAGLMRRLQRRFHNFGRNGAVTFALSGLDIALWDIAAKAAGKPLHALLGGARRERVPAYASLLRYGDAGHVARNTAEAIRRGYRRIKLHEVDLGCIRAAREAAPAEVPLMLDINCAWDSVEQAVGFCRAVQGMNVRWVEEPVWPPEDFAAIAAVRRAGGTGIAAGECLGSPESIGTMLAAGAVDVVQPSVTKVGGVSAMLAVRDLAARHGAALVPHCPYYGPGLLASLHVLACAEVEEPLEYYFADLAAPPYPALIPRDGYVAVPQGPGLGLEIDPALLAGAG
ncbi:mandelate racemase/muconate lactonizing enzyme family protein [Roseicella sp. DB1501]|uniref:mandelate racemase/muconate lactonizing enzyme family protein n=1 Tax=Roseicella sp. DB1501 TaxID=2730925 RepID=UPI001490C79B|nr:mandelate racemase/muconate lactonizing enzyme family protein [Roseicella sp. DB1501]NOG70995.1 mandelate racemase/muconate lactonizing enzyme family protein [Roseicella sp. DB1501]